MRLLALLVCVVWTSSAVAENRNERIRRSAGSSDRGGTADDGRRSSSSSSDLSDLAGCCNAACSVISFCDTCSGPVVVVDARSPHPSSTYVATGPTPPIGFDLTVAGQWVPGDNPTVAGHGRMALTLPFVGWLGVRGGVEHSSWLEKIPTRFDEGATVPAHWDHLPLSTVRGGLVVDGGQWDVHVFGSLRLLWLPDAIAVGVDAGVSGHAAWGEWFAEAGVAAMGFEGFWGLEPWLRGGRAMGPLRLGLGWRHLHLFDGGLVPLTGPELSVGLKF